MSLGGNVTITLSSRGAIEPHCHYRADVLKGILTDSSEMRIREHD